MPIRKQLPLALGLALGLQVPALAGPEAAPVQSAPSNPGDWCEWLQNKPGTLYKNKENPILQGFQVGGRFQYQAAYLDGEDVNGRDFNDTYDEYRRVRIETKTDFLQFFSANVKLNMVNDGRRSGNDLDWGYDTFDEAVFSFDIKKAFGAGALDEFKLNYGRFKFNMTEEVHMSSKEIYTIERSAIANKLYGANNRPTGVTLDAALGKWSGTVGVFSGEDDSEFIGGWNDGQAYYLSLANEMSDEWRLVLDLVVNDESGADDFLGYAWATAFNAIYEKDRFGALATLALGENNGSGNRGGSFHSLMVMPHYWILEDRLQAVFQYQYAGASEDQGIGSNGRYLNSRHSTGVDVNSGRGDELHTLYAGLNYHLCGDNLKLMGGIEYATLDTPKGDVDAVTYLIAFRTFF
ncbi:MAG: hypothetical protein EHM17_09400 [Verrucomicrobiaceae bacterium]|nr:MAG: hypothetical protein EHM17_09400 [Verrucomicrobiaceae bacterium]